MLSMLFDGSPVVFEVPLVRLFNGVEVWTKRLRDFHILEESTRIEMNGAAPTPILDRTGCF